MKIIPLTRGKEVVVDDEDYGELSKFKWYCHSEGYACRDDWSTGSRIQVFMHRALVNAQKIDQVDHRNRNRLDNRRSNLRLASFNQNNRNMNKRRDNKSGFRGVCFAKREGKWRAQIGVDGKHKDLGRYADPETAARVYDRAALKYHGEFASTNFPKTEYEATTN